MKSLLVCWLRRLDDVVVDECIVMCNEATMQ
jgi:hypothetical protein